MSSRKKSNSGTEKNAGKLFQPVKEWGEVPFALAEIVAETEEAMPHVARIADSILDQMLAAPSLKLLELPEEARAEIAGIVARYQAA